MQEKKEYYLSKGFNEKMALYYANGRKKLISANAKDNYTLLLCYEPNEMRLFDVAPLIQPGTVFAVLADKEVFKRVYVDDTHSICWDINPNVDSHVVWSNKVDLCPDSCYVDSLPVELAESV